MSRYTFSSEQDLLAFTIDCIHIRNELNRGRREWLIIGEKRLTVYQLHLKPKYKRMYDVFAAISNTEYERMKRSGEKLVISSRVDIVEIEGTLFANIIVCDNEE